MANIRVIPASVNQFNPLNTNLIKRRVCGYARVSTDRDEQFTSFQAQKDYYEKYIKSKPDWEFVGLYSDEGITGTNIKNRDGFKQMIDDALAGKIDLIITKSVSRFARNTVDTLVFIRKLKEAGVEIYFEKENIYTFDSKGEMLLTLMSSLAQEESRSISENVTWGHRNNFKNGKVYIPYAHFLGYDKGADGKPVINKEEAEIVRFIYSKFIEGLTAYEIARLLTSNHITSPGGKEKWATTTVESILTNEKYKGDALLQKGITVNFLEHKRKINEGEVEQYYVENSHPAIIEKSEWDYVQLEMKRRKEIGRAYSAHSTFSCRLICGDCGGYFGPKIWHSNDEYKTTIWRCNNKYKNDKTCKVPHITFEQVKNAFIKAFNQLSINKDSVIEFIEKQCKNLIILEDLDKEISKKKVEVDGLFADLKEMIETNKSVEEYNALKIRYSNSAEELNAMCKNRKEQEQRKTAIDTYIANFKKLPTVIADWDSRIWNLMIDKAVVNGNKTITFFFKNGQQININL